MLEEIKNKIEEHNIERRKHVQAQNVLIENYGIKMDEEHYNESQHHFLKEAECLASMKALEWVLKIYR